MRTSVIISNYNYAHFLSTAIDSVLNQTIAAHEIIVVDDGSTDDSLAVLSVYGDKIKTIQQKNAGQAAAISRGFDQADGDIVCLLDADDFFSPDKIAVLQSLYLKHPSIGWIFHALKHVAENDNIVFQREGRPAAYRKVDERSAMKAGRLDYDPPATSGLTFRRSFISPLFPLPQANSIDVSDHYIKFYALAMGSGFHVDEELSGQLVHGENLYTGKKNLATRARIFINTAYFLSRVAPGIVMFCDRIMESGIACALRTGQVVKLRRSIWHYLRLRPLPERTLIVLKSVYKIRRQ